MAFWILALRSQALKFHDAGDPGGARTHGERGCFFVSKKFPLDSDSFSHQHLPSRVTFRTGLRSGGWACFFGSETRSG